MIGNGSSSKSEASKRKKDSRNGGYGTIHILILIITAAGLVALQMRYSAVLTIHGNYDENDAHHQKCHCAVDHGNSSGLSRHQLPPDPVSCANITTKLPTVASAYSSSETRIQRLIRPRPRRDNKTAAICAMMMEEEANVDEWVDFNLGIGFSHIHIHDNTELFELEQWAMERQTIFNDPITIHHDPRKASQRQAYRQCAEEMYNLGHDWTFFADVDEFLVIKNRTKYPHVVDMLVDQVPTGAIAVFWRVFGKSYRKTFEPVPVTKRFQFRTREDFRANRQVKSIVHMNSFNFSVKSLRTPHYYPLKKIAGVSYKTLNPDIAVIHHYRYKSFTEYLRKRLKGDVLFKGIRQVPEAKEGKLNQNEYIPNGTIFDDQAWQILKDVAPRYRFYDDFYQIPLHTPDPGDV